MNAVRHHARVEVTHLRKVYGSGHTEVVAMRDASLSIARGEIVGMFGPSGSGKSTLLTAMALINPPTSGQITIGGKPVMDGPRALVDLRAFRRQNLGFVFQKANLIPFLTALENVQIALEVNDTAPRAARKRAMELLDYLGVGPRANNLPVALSGGEQQRVAVARALANNPSLILADEPTAALDSDRRPPGHGTLRQNRPRAPRRRHRRHPRPPHARCLRPDSRCRGRHDQSSLRTLTR